MIGFPAARRQPEGLLFLLPGSPAAAVLLPLLPLLLLLLGGATGAAAAKGADGADGADGAACASGGDEDPEDLAICPDHAREADPPAESSRGDALLQVGAATLHGQHQHTIASFNCTERPLMCEKPFSCNKTHKRQVWRRLLDKLKKPVSAQGKPDLSAWCVSPTYDNTLIKNCLVDKNLKKHAQVLFNWTVKEGIGELDGSYCFLEGYCVDDKVKYNTTVDEAVDLCNSAYPDWKSFKYPDLAFANFRHPEGGDKKEGFNTRDITSQFARAACAMGNYHCDVVYCRDTFCKKPHYRNKYCKFLQAFGYRCNGKEGFEKLPGKEKSP